MLTISNLSILFDKKAVVNKLSFSIEKGRCLGLVGESGSGKSMTALAIMQLLPDAARITRNSEIYVEEQNIFSLTEQQMRRYRGGKIGMIFQDATSAFNPVMTIAQQMREALTHQPQLNKRQARDYALSLLDKVGIRETQRCYQAFPHQLSGGMRQRAMIAMALCGKPDIIIADEPTTALDVTVQAQVMALLQNLCQQEQLTLLFITHNLALVSHLADDVLVLRQGQCVEKSSSRQFFQYPKEEYTKKLLNAVTLPEPLTVCGNDQACTLITVDHLENYFYGKRNWKWQRDVVKAVNDLSFSIKAGKTLAIIGESGSGKTTIAKTLARLYRASSGSIHSSIKPRDIQMIFQDPYGSLNPRRMIADSIMEGMIAQNIIRQRDTRLAKVDQLLQRVGLRPEHKWRYPHAFSGGEKQRICIARALALQAKLLILDEPTSALDVSTQKQVLELLRELQQQDKMAYLLITHDFSVVSFLAHEVIVMYQGKIVETGTAQAVLQQPQHAYTRQLINAMPKIRSVND